MTPQGPAGHTLGERRWPEVATFGSSVLLVVPVGSVEQHGPHLPLDTDTRIANELSHRLASDLARDPSAHGRSTGEHSTAALSTAESGDPGQPSALGGAVVAPAIAYGASGEHADFRDVVDRDELLEQLVIELVRSARASFGGVVLVSGHGGNADALDRAVRRCRYEGDRVMVAGVGFPGSDAHAGRTETSIMLALDPEVVRMADARPGRTEPLAQLLPELRDKGVRAVSGNGVLGDPTGANPDEGRRLLQAAADRLVEEVAGWWSCRGADEHRTAGAPMSTAPQGRR